MQPPRIIVNAKAYDQVLGRHGLLALAEACQHAARTADITIGLAPPQTMLGVATYAGHDRVAVFAQHCDDMDTGAATGFVPVEAVRLAGAVGSLVNHAEHKIEGVAGVVGRLEGAGLWSLVCADGMDEVRELARLAPTYVAVEPPELIGGDVSVTSADPGIVRDAAKAVTKASPATRPLCGAGVKGAEDVAVAVRLGSYGVLLASGVVKAEDAKAALLDLASGL